MEARVIELSSGILLAQILISVLTFKGSSLLLSPSAMLRRVVISNSLIYLHMAQLKKRFERGFDGTSPNDHHTSTAMNTVCVEVLLQSYLQHTVFCL